MGKRKTTISQKQQNHNREKNEVKPGVLAKYFPMIRTRQEILDIIDENSQLAGVFYSWKTSAQQEFLDFCSGMKGMKILYDGFFKEIFNPEVVPHRLETLLSLILERQVSIKTVLTNDSVRLGAETSLLYTDIIVQLEDGSLADIEIQKIGYAFPGERCACYSADLLLQQYKRVRKNAKKKKFYYRDIKPVYTIVLFEKSPTEFRKYKDIYLHRFEQRSDTGLELQLLQKYIFVSLDIFRSIHQNEDKSMTLRNRLDAWFAFLSSDEPEAIVSIIEAYPEFREMYEQVYDICRNIDEVMQMFSKELRELDKNTVELMIDEMQKELDNLKDFRSKLQDNNAQLKEDNVQLKEDNAQLQENNAQLQSELAQREQEINALQAELQKLRKG